MHCVSISCNPVARPFATARIALLALGMFAATVPADAQSDATSTLSQSARIEATFNLRINGETVTDTSSPHAPSAWQGSFSAKDMRPADASSGMRLINKPGESFVVRAQRGGETWELECQTTPLAGSSIEMHVLARHNDGFVSEQRQTLADGETKSLEIGTPNVADAAADRLRLTYTLQRIDAASLPADRTGAFKQAAIDVGASTGDKAAASAASPSKPSEITSYRRMRPPRYPPSAVRAGVQGKVVVNVLVGADGVPSSAEVFGIEPSSAVELGGAAVAAAIQWRYNPAMRDGAAAGASLFVPVDFFLRPDKGERIPEPDPGRSVPLSYRRLTLPVYPAAAVRDSIAGDVFVRAEIAADGSLVAARVEQIAPDTAAELGEAALAAVKQWRFAPEMIAGVARASVARIPFEFRTDPNTAPAAVVQPGLEPVANTLQKIVVTP